MTSPDVFAADSEPAVMIRMINAATRAKDTQTTERAELLEDDKRPLTCTKETQNTVDA